MEIIQSVQNRIYLIRGQRVILDKDIAFLYETETKVLNQAVNRNIKRFPLDFMFQLTKEEVDLLRLQKNQDNEVIPNLRSQIVTSSLESWGGNRYLPNAFTEQGVAMLSGIVNSDKAIQMNIAIMRAFVLMRQFALTYQDLSEQLKDLENRHNQKFDDIEQVLKYLIQKDKKQIQKGERKQVGYKK
jgi:hypothetical protein